MPIGHLVEVLDPPAPDPIRDAAGKLKHRDFLVVALVVPEEQAFPDNWIYIHSPDVRVGRIQNFGSWSPYMVQGSSTCLGMEYFVNEGDSIWTMSDEDLITMAWGEVTSLGLVAAGPVPQGYVVRCPDAYPVYDSEYQSSLDAVREFLEVQWPNVHPVGRNGMHRYNNQDHSMLAGHHAALTLLGRKDLDPWEVNTERSYYEEQVLTPDNKHEGTDILVADKTLPHESV